MTTPMNGRVTTVRGRGNQSVGGSTAGAAGSSGSGSMGGQVVNRSASGGGAYPLSSRGGSGVKGFSHRLAKFEARLSMLEMGARAGQISFTSMLDGDMKAHNLLGELKMSLGKQSDGKWGIVYASGEAPPKPTDPLVSARQLAFVVGWDGNFADGFDKPTDFARIDVHVSTEGPDFVPIGATASGSIFGEGAISIPGNIQNYWVKLVAVSLADVPSPPSAALTVRPLPAAAIAAETIAGIHFAGEIFMGTTFIAGRPDKAHIEWNPSGIAMYREDRTPTVVFSTDEGNALITGSIQTSLKQTGKSRIVFNPFPDLDWNEIRFYSPNDAKWSSLFASRDRFGEDGALTLQGFANQTSPIASIVTLGEQSVQIGIVSRTGTDSAGNPIQDGINFRPDEVALLGTRGPFVVSNYNVSGGVPSPYYLDPILGWVDNAESGIIHPWTAIEFAEAGSDPDPLYPNYPTRWPAIRNSGNDVSLTFGGRINGQRQFGVFCYNYALNALIPLYCSAVNPTSGRNVKEDIEPMPISGLSAVMSVEPVQFRRKPYSTRSHQIYVPDTAAPNYSSEELDLARSRRRNDGLIPAGRRPKAERNPLQYGLIAEDIEAVAPTAIIDGPEDHKLINDTSVLALMWGAIRELKGLHDGLEQRLDTLES